MHNSTDLVTLLNMSTEHKARAQKPTSQARRPARPAPMDRARADMTYRLHFWMIGIAAGLIAASMLAHFFQPTDRLWERLIDVSLAFLFGKFTNRMGQSFLPDKPANKPTDPVAQEGEGQ